MKRNNLETQNVAVSETRIIKKRFLKTNKKKLSIEQHFVVPWEVVEKNKTKTKYTQNAVH